MTSFTFSPRIVELMKRQITIVCIDLKKITDDELYLFYEKDYERYDKTFGDFSIQFQCVFDNSQRMINMESIDVIISCNNHDFIHKTLMSVRSRNIYEYDVICELFRYEHHVFRFCKLEYCNELCLCKEEDLCRNDYLYNYHHEDRCCVCLENDGSWTKLKCNHFIHTVCIEKLSDIDTNYKHDTLEITCPLCKQTTDFCDLEKNYLFL